MVVVKLVREKRWWEGEEFVFLFFLFLFFLLFFFSVYSLQTFFFFSFFVFPCFFFCFFLCFFFPFFSSSPSPPGEGGIYKGKKRERLTLPLSSLAKGVKTLGNHYVAIPGPHIGLVPSTPFIIVVGHERDVSCVSVFRQVRERGEGDAAMEGKQNLLLLPTTHLGEEEDA